MEENVIVQASRESAQPRRYVVKVIGAPEGSENQPMSKTLASPDWGGLAGSFEDYPLDPLWLATRTEESSDLTACIGAMKTNIDGLGHRLVLANPKTDPNDPVVAAERTDIENFFDNCADTLSFEGLRQQQRHDYEQIGWRCMEVIRHPEGQAIVGFTHIPAYQLKVGKTEADYTSVPTPRYKKNPDGTRKIEEITVLKRMRIYAQSSSGKIVYYKEFGDPRIVERATGKILTEEEAKSWKDTGKPIPYTEQANEVVYVAQYCPRSPYGLPRYTGALLAISGVRTSEEANYSTLKNNNVPSMLIVVKNGVLAEGSWEALQTFVKEQMQGLVNYSRFVVISVDPSEDGEGGGANADVDVQPLKEVQQTDAMFTEYEKTNRPKIRICFRLPPLLVGLADDYTRATADTARRVADEQVFAPERKVEDHWYNRQLFPRMGWLYWEFVSNQPNTTDHDVLGRVAGSIERTGGMTPRISRGLLSDMTGKDYGNMDEEKFDLDVPFSLTMAEAVQNKAAPNEVGQQVTALKNVGSDPQAVIDAQAIVNAIEAVLEQRMADLVELRDRAEAALDPTEEKP